MTVLQRTNLVLEGFNTRKLLDEKSLWSKYFELVAKTVDAIKADDTEEVQKLYKKVVTEFNNLSGAEDEDYFNQDQFVDRITTYLKAEGLSTTF